ncbi:type II secretion system protein GspJ [Sphingomonas japonica]|uniref:Type II secretion system protein J n=1 Tax=Sphingomonas japonica TaxID=511662 RepID=A0ABX0U241_9SPHN|nr:type II secretion system protein GspJ [Sphingomonas japonica]NIJ24553.1 general secretion pathway protein J [Sphingomonas japonica]
MPQAGEQRDAAAGFTLIELMISLGLFALIAVAGLALVDSILGVERRTEVRFDRMADLQRAMLLMSTDIDQVARGRIIGGGSELIFTRAAPGFGGPPVEIRYTLAAGSLIRTVQGIPQVVLTGVQGARWGFYEGAGWQPRWPLSEETAEQWPRAVAVELSVSASPGGMLRRVVALPAAPAYGEVR